MELSMTTHGDNGFSRRHLFQAAAAVATALGLPAPAEAHGGRGNDGRDKDEELVLVNGLIHTMDDRNAVVNAVSIRGGRIAGVGRDAHAGRDAKVINLRGRTVVPG